MNNITYIANENYENYENDENILIYMTYMYISNMCFDIQIL